MITLRPKAKFDKSATVIFFQQDQINKSSVPLSHKEIRRRVLDIIHSGQFSGENGELFPVISNKKIILMAGLGKKEKFSLTALRTTVKNTVQSTFLGKIKDIEIITHEQTDQVIKAAVEGILIGAYKWKKYQTKDKNDKTVDQKDIYLVADRKNIFDEAIKVCEGVNLARDLINDNADTVTSEYFEKIIRHLIKGKKNITVEVLNRKEMTAKGLGLHLAVNQGSPKEPKLIIVKYHGSPQKDKFTALIGKGMTFDTGGLNLKPTGSIETMRTDMSGAAAVVGLLKNTIALNLKKNIIFVCALAENAIGAKSYKPGDVFRSYSGKTVEIANTDAEGRLVLADAISYVVKNYKPARMIDLATLTGACVVALGHDYAGLVTTDDQLSRQLVHSSNETDDRAWRLPNYPEIKEAVKSQIADIRNLGFSKGAAGALTAAEFLRQFTEDTPWAHFDIAGTAYVDGHKRLYYGHGATGFGVRLLTHYLQNYA